MEVSFTNGHCGQSTKPFSSIKHSLKLTQKLTEVMELLFRVNCVVSYNVIYEFFKAISMSFEHLCLRLIFI